SYAGNLNYNGSDTIAFSVTDTFGGIVEIGRASCRGSKKNIRVAVNAVKNPVRASAPASETGNEDSSGAVTGLAIADVDATLASNGVYSVTLSARNGALTLSTVTGLTFDGGTANGTGTLTYHGTLANISPALGTASYAGNLNYNGSDTIAFSVTDTFGGIVATGTGSATSENQKISETVNALNHPVTASAPASETGNQDHSVAVTGLSIADVAATLVPIGDYSVPLSETTGALTLPSVTGLTFDGGTSYFNCSLALHDPLSFPTRRSSDLSYAGNLNYNGSDTIAFSVTDTFGGIVAT